VAVGVFLKSALWGILAFAAMARGEDYPVGWDNYILLDQLSNVPTRKGETLSAEASQIVPVHHIDIPASRVQTVQSKYLDEVTRKRVLVEKDGVPHVRVFFVEVPGIPFQKIRELGFPVESHYWGTKMQSHMTYLVWEKANPKAPPFFVKMSRRDEHAVHNGLGNARQAIKNNDFVETVLRKSGHTFATVFPERFGSGLNDLGLNYANSLREARPLHSPPGAELTPIHGLMGSKSDLEALAKARGLKSPGEWIEKEYLPKLGHFLADLHFRQGIYLEAHSQNIMAQLDRRTGKIVGMVGRDLNDVLLDPFVHAAQGNPLHFDRPDQAPSSLMNSRFVDAVLGKYAGYHMGIYPAQSIVDITRDPAERTRYTALFLEAYRASAEKATGRPLPLSETAKRLLQALHSNTSPPHHGYSDEYGEPEGSLMLVAQEIYDKATEARLAKLREQGKSVDHVRMQWTLELQFWNRFRSDRVAFLSPEALGHLKDGKIPLRFEPTKAGVLAVDRRTLAPLGLAYDLSDAQKAQIEKARIPHWKWVDGLIRWALKNFSGCSLAFRSL
jgi:hypothetical protein